MLILPIVVWLLDLWQLVVGSIRASGSVLQIIAAVVRATKPIKPINSISDEIWSNVLNSLGESMTNRLQSAILDVSALKASYLLPIASFVDSSAPTFTMAGGDNTHGIYSRINDNSQVSWSNSTFILSESLLNAALEVYRQNHQHYGKDIRGQHDITVNINFIRFDDGNRLVIGLGGDVDIDFGVGIAHWDIIFEDNMSVPITLDINSSGQLRIFNYSQARVPGFHLNATNFLARGSTLIFTAAAVLGTFMANGLVKDMFPANTLDFSFDLPKTAVIPLSNPWEHGPKQPNSVNFTFDGYTLSVSTNYPKVVYVQFVVKHFSIDPPPDPDLSLLSKL
jgi:hypothetical protein